MALASAGLGLAIGTAGGGDEKPERQAGTSERRATRTARPRISLERQVGSLLVLSFDGTAAPEYIHRRLRTGELSGVILFEKNVVAEEGLRELTSGLQRSARGRALIATDQEGGEIRSVPFAGPETSQSGIASEDVAGSAAGEAAARLRELGVNVTLAPVADVAERGSAFSGRTFPGEPDAVAGSVRAAVRSYERARVGATPKHFPGLGEARANTDDVPVTIEAERDVIDGRDLVPFRAAVEAGASLVMLSHAVYPAYDAERIASQSPVLIGDVLRKRLGFRGVAITDSIEAQAVLERSDVAIAAERSVAAGADVILMTGTATWKEVYPHLLRRARASAAFRRQVARAATRVRRLQRRLRARGG